MSFLSVRRPLAALLLVALPGLVHAQNPAELARWGISPEQAQAHPAETAVWLQGRNPHPVTYHLPENQPLSAVARLGRQLFLDPSLSASGQYSCASCHVPANACEPPAAMRAVMIGGPHLDQPGTRPPPSLRYLYRQNVFSIGPDLADQDDTNPGAALQPPALGTQIAVKTATTTATSAVNMVPQGGMFWDGRADTLQQQADGPLMNPVEMSAFSHQWVAQRLERAPYAETFRKLFGPGIFGTPELLISEMEFAIARYQIEDRAGFSPFTSKYDAWLQGRARFTPTEQRGYFAFNDPQRGNCAACHLAKPGKDGLPPLFTDQQYEALGVPRNPEIPANQDAGWFDLGICGPFRTDFSDQTQYCGMFLTPTLRNVAVRSVFFHNSRYTTLQQVMDFYNLRDTNPGKIYPHDAQGRVLKYDDLPAQYRDNIDVVDPPFDRHLGDTPAMTTQDEHDIIAFLKTLTDADVVKNMHE